MEGAKGTCNCKILFGVNFESGVRKRCLLHVQSAKNTVKPVLSGHSKRRPKIGFQDQLSLNAGQKYCRMLPLEHSAILSTLIKLPVVFKTFVFFLQFLIDL